jgi:RNA polymerase sigma-70 factor (ECF subfamily)
MDLERGIAELPEAAREVFVLHEIYGFTHEEVGDLLGIEAGTSKSQLHHARRALREFLGEDNEERN